MIDTHWLQLKPKTWESIIGADEEDRTYMSIQSECAVRMDITKFYIEGIPEPLESCVASLFIRHTYEKAKPYAVLGDMSDPIDKFMQPQGGLKPSFGGVKLLDGDDTFFVIRLYPGPDVFDDLWGRLRQNGAMPTDIRLGLGGVTRDDHLNVIWTNKTNDGWLPVIDFRLTSKVQVPATVTSLASSR